MSNQVASFIDELVAETKEKMPDFLDDSRAETTPAEPEAPEAPADPAEGEPEAPEPPEEGEPEALTEPPTYETLLSDEQLAEIATDEERAEEEDEDDEDIYDPRIADARRRQREAEKRAAFLERQLLEAKHGDWRKEATDHFPLLPETVRDDMIRQATSHREFLRLAKSRHDEYVLVANKARADVMAHVDKLKAQAVADGRQEAEAAWGRPTVNASGTTVPARAEEIRMAEEKHRNARTLADKVMARLATPQRR